MNEQLKFSWGHIVAFLALIIIAYISFMGITYLTDGDFAVASISTIVIVVVLLLFFIGSQMMKAATRKFAIKIWFERFFIFLSPVIFIFAMIPYFHFWTVHSQDNEIVSNFTNAINASTQMFKDYEKYSNDRIDNYNNMLERVIQNKPIHPEDFKSCGFSEGSENIQKQNMLKTLRLQLLSENYDSLHVSATKWIESSSRGASTWNVFLLGNTKEIKTAINEWHNQLVGFTNNRLSNEEFQNFNRVINWQESSILSVNDGLDSLTIMFVTRHFPNLISIFTSILLYFMLLFPYILQDRHTKSLCRLFKTMNYGNDYNTQKPTQESSEDNIYKPF